MTANGIYRLAVKKLDEILDDLYNGTWDERKLHAALKLYKEIVGEKVKRSKTIDVYNFLIERKSELTSYLGYTPKNGKESRIMEMIYRTAKEHPAISHLFIKENSYSALGLYKYRIKTELEYSGKVDWVAKEAWDDSDDRYTMDMEIKAKYIHASERASSTGFKAMEKDLSRNRPDWVTQLIMMGIAQMQYPEYKHVILESDDGLGRRYNSIIDAKAKGYTEYKVKYKIDFYALASLLDKMMSEKKQIFVNSKANEFYESFKAVVEDAMDYYSLGYDKDEITEYLRPKVKTLKKMLHEII